MCQSAVPVLWQADPGAFDDLLGEPDVVSAAMPGGIRLRQHSGLDNELVGTAALPDVDEATVIWRCDAVPTGWRHRLEVDLFDQPVTIMLTTHTNEQTVGGADVQLVSVTSDLARVTGISERRAGSWDDQFARQLAAVLADRAPAPTPAAHQDHGAAPANPAADPGAAAASATPTSSRDQNLPAAPNSVHTSRTAVLDDRWKMTIVALVGFAAIGWLIRTARRTRPVESP